MKIFRILTAAMVMAVSIMSLKFKSGAETAPQVDPLDHTFESAVKSDKPEINTEPPYNAKECIAALNASYEQMRASYASVRTDDTSALSQSTESEEKMSESEEETQESREVLSESEEELPESESESAAPDARYAISDDEREAIERIVASEGGYCGYEFQALVAECILNGAEAEGMRPTELFDRGDFWLTHNVAPTEDTKKAVSDVFDLGIMPTSEKVRYYYNPKICKSDVHESMCYVLTCCDCRFFKDWE